jgi:hypothetical protein
VDGKPIECREMLKNDTVSKDASFYMAIHHGHAARRAQPTKTFNPRSSTQNFQEPDRHCQQLAQSAGAGDRTWRAYLSTQAAGGQPAVNARDRIGPGPWRNAKATIIARDVNELHYANNLTKETALTEKGDVVSGRGDTPNRHDILTGSQPDGTAFTVAEDRTCGNWTRSGAEGAAMVGHHDRRGLSEDPPAKSWNSSHLTRGECSQEALRGTGGAGLLYCFAAD